jgi:endonuclease YncB( thermonuclease family)
MLDRITRLPRRWRARTMLGRPPWRIDLRRQGRRQRGEWWRMTKAPWIVVVALLAAALAGYQLVEPDAAAFALQGPGSATTTTHGAFRLCAEQRRVNCVVDGDTIWHRGVKIRLADIDTPEVFSPQCASEAALGRQATERLLALINAGPFEVVQSGRDADRYGRKLRILERHGRSLGDILVAEGLARRWDGARRSWCG